MAVGTTPGTAAPANSSTSQPSGSYAPGSNGYTPGGNSYSPGNNSYTPSANGYQPGNNGYNPPGSTPYTSPTSSYSAPTGSADPHYRPGSTSDWNPSNLPSTSNPNSAAPSYGGYPSSQPSQNSATAAGGVMPASYAQPSPITTIPNTSNVSTAGSPSSTMR
jgi:hypothetical protein